MPTDIQEVRRRNLRRLVTDHDGMNNLARKLGLTKGAYISQLLSEKPLRAISEKVARKWERTLGLAYGCLDEKGQTSLPEIDTPMLERVLAEVLQALKEADVEVPPASFAELVTMQYSDACVLGQVDSERIRKLVRILKR